MYLSQLVALANTFDPYYLLINIPAPPPEGGSNPSNCSGTALVLRWYCVGTAVVLRWYLVGGCALASRNERFVP